MTPEQALEYASSKANRPRSRSMTSYPAGLSAREVEVLRLVAKGLTNAQIAAELFISPRTVNAHVRNMLSKTGAANRVELAMWARTEGIVTS